MNAIECPDCGKSNAVGNSFCIGCGRELSSLAIEPTVEAIAISVCPNCGKENERDNLFCVGCGTQLRSTEDAASEPEPSARSCPQCGKPFAEGDAFCVFAARPWGREMQRRSSRLCSRQVKRRKAGQKKAYFARQRACLAGSSSLYACSFCCWLHLCYSPHSARQGTWGIIRRLQARRQLRFQMGPVMLQAKYLELRRAM